MKIYSWNVNGIRASSKGGFSKWFEDHDADIVCVQEIKAFKEQLAEDILNPRGFHSFWLPAEKPGYSGVAIYSKKEPQAIIEGMGVPEFDREGRVLAADFGDTVVISSYFPNSQREHTRLPYKLEFCKQMEKYLKGYAKKGKHVVLCGDYNIAHKEIDLKNPKSNQKNAGFLPEERAWMDRFTGDLGYVDTFRHFEPGPDHYSWWSYRPGVREKNIGWRLDYACVNAELKDRLKGASILPEVRGSDHCPVKLVLKK